MRAATDPKLKTFVRAACLICAATMVGVAAVAPAKAENVRLNPREARNIAIEALHRGQPQIAAQLALGLLQVNRQNGEAQFILARAFQLMRRPDEARKPARLAFSLAESDRARFQAAQLAAQLAVQDEAHLAAQMWLRRSLLHLPEEKLRQQVVRDYKKVRRLSPWQVNLKTSLAPSDNLNNGANSASSTIDGVPVFGTLSGDAQALSGLRAGVDVGVNYRLNASKSHATFAALRYYGQRVRLSDDARALAPDTENADLAFDYFELGLNQTRKAGSAGQWTYGISLGHSRSGGEAYLNSQRLKLGRGWRLAPQTRFSLTGQVERLRYESDVPEARNLSLDGRLSHNAANGHRYSLSVNLKTTNSDNHNSRQDKITTSLGWHSGRAFGPITPSASLGASLQRYPDYAIGFIAVPGGREDQSVFGQIEFTLQALDYGGFVPSLTVQARKTSSNVSRFETRETTVSLGIKSSF